MALGLADFYEAVAEQPAFPPAEYEARQAKARAAMAEAGIDLLVLFDPQNVCYFTGYESVNLWDTGAVLVPLDAPVRVVLWEFEAYRFQASAALGELYTYPSHEPMLDALALAASGLPQGSVASDTWTPAVSPELWRSIGDVFAGSELHDARRVLWATRLVKSPLELDVLRRSAAITDRGVAAAATACRVGATDREIAAAASAEMLAAGSGHFAIQPIVAVGPRAGMAHSEASGRLIAEGEGVFLEFGASVHRYTAPVMRTVCVGEPHEDLVRLADVAAAAVEAAGAEARPGARASDVARAAHDIIDDGLDDVLFHGYVGYSVGISFPPSWLEDLAFNIHRGNHEPLVAGMVFHLPISLRRGATRGVGLSVTALVTEQGAQPLTGTPTQLIHAS